MENNLSRVGSDAWYPDLQRLCYAYWANLKKRPGGEHLKINYDAVGVDGREGAILTEYHSILTEFKQSVYGAKASAARVDYHKIAAMYIKSILKNRPFFNDVESPETFFEVTWCCKLANEFFVIPYLATIFKACNAPDGILRLEPNYRAHFIKLLHHYFGSPSSFDIPSVANIIFLIEKHYFSRPPCGDFCELRG